MIYLDLFVTARRLGQAINPILIHVINCGIIGWCSSRCPGANVSQFGCVKLFVIFLALRHLKVVAEWMSGDRSQVIVWSTTANSDVVYHSVNLQNQAVFNEIATQQEWGTLHIAMKSVGQKFVRSAFRHSRFMA